MTAALVILAVIAYAAFGALAFALCRTAAISDRQTVVDEQSLAAELEALRVGMAAHRERTRAVGES